MALGHAIGLSNLTAFKLTADDASALTYGDAIALPEIISMSITPETDEATLYADDQAVDTANQTKKFTLEVNMAQISLEHQALLLGHEFAGGEMIAKADDVAPFFCLAFKSLKSNGAYRYTKFFKVKFAEQKVEQKTKGESIEFQTPTLTATAVYTTNTKTSFKYADEDEGYDDTTATKPWFSSAI